MKTTLTLVAALAFIGFSAGVNAQGTMPAAAGTKPAAKSEEKMETKKEEAMENSKTSMPMKHRAKTHHGKRASKSKM